MVVSEPSSRTHFACGCGQSVPSFKSLCTTSIAHQVRRDWIREQTPVALLSRATSLKSKTVPIVSV